MSDVRSYEEWRSIPGYEGLYEISSIGRVRSLDRTVRHWRGGESHLRGKIKRTPIDGQGYRVVNLAQEGKQRTMAVHRLVALAFLGTPPGGTMVCHGDGDCLNNQADNLYYGTAEDNAQDRVRHGRHFHANKTHCVRGHEFTVENTYRVPTGGRRCRACVRLKKKEREDGRRALVLATE